MIRMPERRAVPATWLIILALMALGSSIYLAILSTLCWLSAH